MVFNCVIILYQHCVRTVLCARTRNQLQNTCRMCDIPPDFNGKDPHKSSQILSVQQNVASKTRSFDSCPLNQHSPLRQEQWSLMHFSQGCGSTCVPNINGVARALPCLASALCGSSMQASICLLWPAQQASYLHLPIP